MKTYVFSIAAVALLCTASVSIAAGLGGYSNWQGTTPQSQSSTTSSINIVYDVEAAEPLPEVGYRVEYWYLEGYGPPGTHVHSTHYNYQDALQSLTWVLIHLVAEGEIVEFTPLPQTLQWERVATFNSLSEAAAHADNLADTGLLTRIKTRQVVRYGTQSRPQFRFP